MERVLAYLKKNQPRFVEELIEYVSIPSVSAQPTHKPDMDRCARWIAARAEGAALSPALATRRNSSRARKSVDFAALGEMPRTTPISAQESP